MHLRAGSRGGGLAKPLVLSILLAFCLGGAVYAQGLMGTLTGTVSDQSNAVIPNAAVVLTQEGTSAVRRTVTNTNGFFSIQAIPAGTYSISVEAPGFRKWERKDLVFHPGDRVNVSDITMQVATAEQSVEVVGIAADVIPVDTGEKAQIITQKEIQNLSVLGRSADELLKILPGVVYNDQDTPAGFTVQFNRGIGNYNVAGTRNTQISNVSDGANIIDPGCNCGSAVTPNMDMIAEVKVQTANFSAENARGPVVFNSISKSGTSNFHGEGYVYARHHSLNSRDWRNNFFDTKKPTDSFYFPGFNIGGPLTKSREKLFFFAGIEIQRQNHDLGVRPAAVPTEAMRKGDFTDAAYINKLFGYDVNTVPLNDAEGNGYTWNGGEDALSTSMLSGGKINPAYFDKGGQVLMNLLPLPNQDPGKSGGYNYTANIVNPEHRHQELTRLDYNISDNTKLYTRFNHEYQSSPYPYTLWWYNSNDVPWPGNVKGDYHTWSSSTSLVKVLDPSTTNEVVFAGTYWGMPHKIENPDKVSRSKLGYPYRGIYKNTTDIVPNMTDWGGGVPDFIQAGGLDKPTVFGNKWLISAADNFSKVVSTHTLKFGAFIEHVTNDEPTTASDMADLEFTNWGGNSTGNAFADMLMGRVSEYGESTENIVGNFRKWEVSGYVQDSWKVSRRLTLELGTRIQYLQWMHEKHGYLFGFDLGKYNPNAPMDDFTGMVAQYKGDDVPIGIWANPGVVLAPRLGWAYDVFGTGRTVVRGGFGIFNHVDRNGDVFGRIGNPPLRRNTTICCGLDLKEIDNLDPTKYVPKPNVSALEIGDNKVPTTYSWSFTLSNRLPGSTVFEASYVGNVSHHQIACDQCNNINVVPYGAMFGLPKGNDANNYRPYQSYGYIRVRGHNLSQNYHSLQVTANRQVGRFNFAGAYTFSKTMGIGGDSYSSAFTSFDMRHQAYGPLSYDRTHSFSIAYYYQIPGLYQNPILKGIFQDWQLSGISQIQSGAPWGGDISFQGSMANIDPETGDFQNMDSRFVNGTDAISARPYLLCDPRKNLAEGQYMNPACFAAPLPGHNGTFQLPYMRAPGFMNHDLSVYKDFKFTEYQRLQFRFSMFNFPNHPNAFLSGRDDDINFEGGKVDADSMKYFGRPTLKRGRRFLQFALKYYF